MPAAKIMLIRHAEKPDEAWPGPGLTPDGVADKKSLVIRGWQRAGAWSTLFGAGLGGVAFPQPVAIYAADSSAAAAEDPSKRAFETITPLAARLRLTPILKPLGAESDLVTEIVRLTGVVLVCWEHKAIADVARAFGVRGPLKFPNVYDRTWIVTFPRGGPPALRDLPQRLMFGDSPR